MSEYRWKGGEQKMGKGASDAGLCTHTHTQPDGGGAGVVGFVCNSELIVFGFTSRK